LDRFVIVNAFKKLYRPNANATVNEIDRVIALPSSPSVAETALQCYHQNQTF